MQDVHYRPALPSPKRGDQNAEQDIKTWEQETRQNSTWNVVKATKPHKNKNNTRTTASERSLAKLPGI